MGLDHLRNRLRAMKSFVQNEDYIAHVLSNLTVRCNTSSREVYTYGPPIIGGPCKACVYRWKGKYTVDNSPLRLPITTCAVDEMIRRCGYESSVELSSGSNGK